VIPPAASRYGREPLRFTLKNGGKGVIIAGRRCDDMSAPTPTRRAEQQAATVPEELLRAVVAYFDPVRVILFGSHARGEAGPDSDYDLLVVLDDDAPAEKLSWRAAWEARKDFHRAVDVVPCRESVFRRRSRLRSSPLAEIAREGVVLYER
jgi:predicted nucleotidyltransferase